MLQEAGKKHSVLKNPMWYPVSYSIQYCTYLTKIRKTIYLCTDESLFFKNTASYYTAVTIYGLAHEKKYFPWQHNSCRFYLYNYVKLAETKIQYMWLNKLFFSFNNVLKEKKKKTKHKRQKNLQVRWDQRPTYTDLCESWL